MTETDISKAAAEPKSARRRNWVGKAVVIIAAIFILAEAYDLAAGKGYMINQSFQGEIHPDQEVLIAGFGVDGRATRRVLIRCVGPTLGNYDVPKPVSDPELKLFDASQVVIAANDNWSAQPAVVDIARAAASLGAFALDNRSTDAAVLVDLSPGAYTVHARGVDGAVGTVLLEVYLLDE